MKKVSVIGCGAFGYAMAVLIAKHHHRIRVYGYDVNDKIIDSLINHKKHPYFFNNTTTQINFIPTHSKKVCLKDADLVVLAVPAQYKRETVKSLATLIPRNAVILNVSKALERSTNKRMSQVIRESLNHKNPVATISGGMLAKDVINGYHVGAEIGCKDKKALRKLAYLFKDTNVHIETTSDIAGVEFGGALKNVIAIGAGIVEGLNFGASAKAFFIAKSLKEIEDLAVKLGAKKRTFHTSSNSWMGDLMTTCYGDSRNLYFGKLIGRGLSKREALDKLREENKHAEGVATLKVVYELMHKNNIKSPLVNTLHNVVYGGANPLRSFRQLRLV